MSGRTDFEAEWKVTRRMVDGFSSGGFRNQLAKTVQAARRVGESGARNAVGMHAVGDARAHPSMSPAEQDLRRRLRAHGRQLGDGRDSETGEQKIDCLVHEVAYEHWHRMLFARFLAENELLIEPESGVAVSLADCEELAHEQGQDRWTLAGRFAELMLPRIFRNDDPALAVRLAPETRQELERLIETLPADIFTARDIDPRAVEADLFQHDYESVRVLLGARLEREHRNDEQTERAVAAHGMARAAELLAGRYHLVITNVPYLARGKQSDVLKQFAQDRHPAAKSDLATLFVSRIFGWLDKHGVQAVVTPQNWLFLTSYKKLREKLLKQRTWNLVARLGPGAFETIGGHVVNVSLNVLSSDKSTETWWMASIDVAELWGQRPMQAHEKAASLREERQVALLPQAEQLRNADHRILSSRTHESSRLDTIAESSHGVGTFDAPQFQLSYWETTLDPLTWKLQQSTAAQSGHWQGCHYILRWEHGIGSLGSLMEAKSLDGYSSGKWRAGVSQWSKAGIVAGQMGEMPVTLYAGNAFDENASVLIPKEPVHLASVWCYCSSADFRICIRQIDKSLKVTCKTLGKVPFDLLRWQAVAAEKYPNGLPRPYSNDPTQWIFHGHPCSSVVWDEDTKRLACGPHRRDGTVLHIAVARLLGFRWPAEEDPDMPLADEMRACVDRCHQFKDLADADGIVCLSAVGGELAAADRLRQLLAAAYGTNWSAATERQLVAATAKNSRPAESIEEWLRDRFFEDHCQLFHQRPFIWHVWDGRRDGFHALVNYHHLAGPDGVGRRTLEALTYSHLGDWMARQKADRDQGFDGADGRLAAAQDLQHQLKKIIAGEPPCDVFVRWKPLGEQPIGWEPDINDGVRINIRPFMSAELSRGGRVGAGILRIKPKIKWSKDRGREPRNLRPQDEYPWFWACPGDGTQTKRTDFRGGPDFDGNRWNDLHYTNAVKWAARSRSTVEAGL